MDQKQAYENESAYPQIGNVVKESNPLQQALDQHGEQLDKLGSLVASLEHRLQPIRNSTPKDSDRAAEGQRGGSAIVTQIGAYTNIAKELQYRVICLLEEIEV